MADRLAAYILRPITEVCPREVRLTLALFLTVFLILTSYYIAKPVRESWLAVSMIGSLSGIEVKAVSGFVQSVALIGLMPIYAWAYERMPRGRLLLRVNTAFIGMFPLFWFLRPESAWAIPFFSHCAGVVFYVWLGVFSVFIVAQFWTFATDIYDEGAGKRVFPLIALGASTGAVAGSLLSGKLIGDWGLDTYTMLLISPAILAVGAAMIWAVDRRVCSARSAEQTSEAEIPDEASADPVLAAGALPSPDVDGDKKGPWAIIGHNRYLLLIAAFVFLANWIATNGENILFAAIQDSIGISHNVEVMSTADQVKMQQEETALVYARLYLWVNVAGMLIQAFIVSRLLKYGGLAAMLLVPPAVSLAAYGAMSGNPTLDVLTGAKTAENATGYSVTGTAREVLWLPVPREALYKAKSAIDTTCVRGADAVAAFTVILGTRVFSATTGGFIALNIGLILVWFGISFAILRERRQTASTQTDLDMAVTA